MGLESQKVVLVISESQNTVEWHYTAATIDNSLPSTQGLATQLSPCRQPAVVLQCITSSTSFRCKYVHDLHDVKEHMAAIASKLSHTKWYNQFAGS